MRLKFAGGPARTKFNIFRFFPTAPDAVIRWKFSIFGRIENDKAMKLKLMLLLAFMPVFLCAAKPGQLSKITVMSYNIRMGEADDGTNSWQFRYPATALMIEDQNPDVFGVQEAYPYQILFIDENCRDYKYVGVGREDGKSEGEHMAIFYNKKTVSLLKWGTFWLSETPDKPTMGWDAACKRTATWALMKSKVSGKKFYFIDTHLDHVGKVAQKEGRALIVSKMKEINRDGLPMVLVGDFNIELSDPAFTVLDGVMKNARKIAADTDNSNTFNGWGKSSTTIDHIFYSGFRSCTKYETITKPYADRKFISDHYPIKAVLVF